MATKNFIEELEWRGMIHTIMPGAKEQLEKEMTTAYLGIDPTADSLHIGHLVGVMILKHFQMCGHRPLALIGGATGMIGDPSGKSQERNLLDDETLYHNQECIKAQVAKFLDFGNDAPNAAEAPMDKDITFENVSFHYGDGVSCEMCEGDSLYFDGFVPHRWENGGEEDAVLVLCGDMPSV